MKSNGTSQSCSGIGEPPRTDLPYFTYGSFKPGQLAHHLIAEFIEEKPVSAAVRGCLHVRDGLPLLDPDATDQVEGSLLRFRSGCQNQAYDKIGQFEPKGHYKWQEVTISDSGTLANCVVGRKLNRGHPEEYDGQSWTFRKDPVFIFGLLPVRSIVETLAQTEFQSAPPETFRDWERFFRLQMGYLLLWAAIERYASLSFGPEIEPTRKVTLMAQDSDFRQALREIVDRTDEVYDSRDPDTILRLSRDDPKHSILYYYQVRSNLTHRGKGASSDGEIVRKSLNELLEVFWRMLKVKGVELGTGICPSPHAN